MFGLFTKPRGISANDAKAMIDQGAATLVDVRTPQEYAQGHIPGALSLPLDRLSAMAQKKLPDKDKPVIVYCLSGRRSAQAVMILTQMGYKDIRNLGGITGWPYGPAQQR